MDKSKLLMLAAAFLLALLIAADDKSADDAYREGLALYQAKDYKAAGDKFEAAEIEADSPAIKANSIRAQIGAWRMCGLLYKEFEAIESLMERFPEYADFVELVKREYEIADAYYQGKRDPAFWSLRWIPWLVGDDKSIEVFEKALDRAPFAESAPEARLRLAYLFDQKGKVKESLEQLRIIIRDFPDAKACRYAYLALANGLYELSRRGDGDGAYNRESYELFKTFLEKYPDAPEAPWVKVRMVRSRDIQAGRLYELAEYYERAGRKEASERYLAQVLKDYPDTTSADASERLLVKLDSTFVPEDFREKPEGRLPHYRTRPIPAEASQLLIAPGDSDRRFLLPVFSVHLPDEQDKEKSK